MQPGDYTPAGAPSIVTWQMKRLAPPSPLYVTVDDVLRCQCATSQTNEVVTVSYKVLRAADGGIVLGQFTVKPPATRAVTAQDNPLSEGFLLAVSCTAAVATTRGQTFVRLLLNPKGLGAGNAVQMLMADYVTTQMAPGFPGGRVLSPVEGPGNPRTVIAGIPAAGANWSQVVPTNARWRWLGVVFTLQTSAAAGNRYVVIDTIHAGSSTYLGMADATQPASILRNYGGAVLTPNVSASPQFGVVPLPPGLDFLAGDTIQTAAQNLDVADQFNSIHLQVAEWLDNV
jgi:hypothetical protein